MKRYINASFPHILHGGDYNPDQWLDCPEILEEDMRLMKLSGCNAMSVGIFAWAALEPDEGRYDFSFLDKTFDDVYKNGGRIILATPSGARPAWMSQKYPEVLRTNSDRTKNLHGVRHNHCFTSPIYRKKVAEINRALAERYKDHPALLVWHISNEYNGECHCELCREAFREWLKRKYGSLDKLNHEWWTAFWAHTYTDWSQIEPPSKKLGEYATDGLTLDWKRFVTYQTTDFMKAEIAAVKAITPDIPVTTNLMGFFEGLDYRELAKEIDVVSWDNYPAWRGDESDIRLASRVALVHDLNRSLKGKPFMLMESAPSHVNWMDYNRLKRPGQHISSSLQAIAHGSDTVQYFQWRKGRNAMEKFHGAVVDHVGNENTRVFREVSELGERLTKLDEIVGALTESRVAILYDWSNRWALDDASAFAKKNKKVMETVEKHYHSLWRRGINVDVCGFEDDFEKYDFIIAPMIYTVSAELEAKMERFVRNGGRLLATYTLGMVNENGLCHLGGFPAGALKEVFGIWNEEIDTLYPDQTCRVISVDKDYLAMDYCEIIHARGAESLAVYDDEFYAGMPAATVNSYGNGKAYYIAFRDKGDFSDKLIGCILDELGIVSDFDGELPLGVTAHSRTDGEKTYVFLENFTDKAARTATALTWRTVENGDEVSGDIILLPYETKILKR